MTQRPVYFGKQWCYLFLLWLLICPNISAQTTSTSIVGTVVDASGAVLPGAKITALNTRTGQKREDVTSSTGDFSFPLLDVGVYDVTVDASGFKQEIRRSVVLQINDKLRVDFALQVGATTEKVEVTATGVTLQTDDATLGLTVEQRRVEELPLNNRNLGVLAILQPGVQYGPRSGTDGQGFGQRQGANGVPIPGVGLAFVANGQRETNQHATLDGVVATEARVNTIPFSPSPEAVQEFRVLSGSYSAEYGFNSGAQTIIVTKSGGNEWHGSAFEYLRNDVFDAENFFQNYFNAAGAARSKKNSLRQNDFGGVLTGPLWVPKVYDGHNKTFFMVNYEARRRRDGGIAQTANHPPLAFRNGDFSSLLALPTPIKIVDPLTGAEFTGNMIPANRISAPAKEFMKFWPEPQRVNANPLTGVNYTGFEQRKLDDDQAFVRVDHNFSEKDKIFGRYAFDEVTYSVIPGDNPNFTYFVAGRNQNLGTAWIHIFSPSFINEARYGYNRSVDNTLNPRANTSFDVEALGVTGFRVVNDGNRKFTPRETGVPTITVNAFSTLSEQDGGNGFDFNNLHQFNDNLTWSHGAHNTKFGFDFRWVDLFRGAANTPRGNITFNGDIANNGFAAFLLGYPSSTGTPEGLPLTYARQKRFAGYATDDWKATRKLTLNLGLRYEYNTPAIDTKGLWRSLTFTQQVNGVPTVVPNIGTPFEFYEAQKKLFMPRLGFAYRWTDRWVVRGGFGIYYNVHQLNNYTILNLNPPKSGTANFANSSTGGRITNAATQPVLTYAAPFGVVSPTLATGINALDPKNDQPYVSQWSLDVQRRLPGDIVLSVGYVGNKGTHIDQTVELNAPAPSILANPGGRRPIPTFIDGAGGPSRPLNRLRWLTSDGNSWYHALQVNAQKRFSKGLQMNVAYTYSKAEGEGYGRNESGGALPNSYQNPHNRAAEKTRYGFDFRHSLVTSYLYELPTLPLFKDNPGKYVFGGWQINSIIQLRSGLPFTVTQTNTINTIEGHVRPDRLASGKLDTPTVNKWYDPDAFRVVTCAQPGSATTTAGQALNSYLAGFCHFGSAGQGILEGPGFKNVDFSLIKNTQVTEKFKLQFRAEIFNLFNTPQFGIPATGLNAATAFLPTATGGAFPTQVTASRGPGSISSIVAPMRQMQFGLKLLF
ncbi:MAG: TonB-dependent receptor [Acidobacteria bacterium]|nr:TonB-dependent receptor [Acidobacteriota bacterium]MBI3427980.1 TonB-dependent receptor [Acidobacteriota bacterium]